MSITTALLLAGGGCFLPIFITGQQIDRWEGALFFGYYIAYALYLKAPLWTNRF